MIALDTSALLAIAMQEPEARLFTRAISDNDCIIGTPTRLEIAIVAGSRSSSAQLLDMNRILALPNVVTIEFTMAHVAPAESAFSRFGKGGGHRAQLNFGDCMAYAVARVAGAPLLFKGNDFGQTDIVPAYVP